MHRIVRELAITMNARNLNIDDAIVDVDLSKNFFLQPQYDFNKKFSIQGSGCTR
jgi:hypothetical protein